jgi:hypothetical protein
MKGQPSDNGYGSPGRDLLDAVAVGRFPARTVEEARQMVRKTIAYETDHRPGEWRRRLTVLAGVPAFNPLVDRLVERLALARLDQINPVWTGRAVYHNASSRFCVPDTRLHDQALAYVQDGQALTLYLGHSWWRGFYAGDARYLTRDDWATLRIPRGPGLFVTFGCYGCQLPGRDREAGYGVAAMRNPNGPVAVIGSHGVCFSAMVQLAANGLFEGLLAHEPPERLGPAWLAIKAGVAHGELDRLTYRLLDAVDGDSRIPQATQRLEHEEMFLLLGDPALRLPVLPADISLKAGPALPGQTLTVTGKLPKRLCDGQVRVTLERPAASEPADLRPLPKSGRERDKVMLENHARANQFVLSTRETTADGSDFTVSFDIPAKPPWRRLLLRAYAVRGSDEGLGVETVKLR